MAEKPERKFAKDFLEKWARAEREGGPADEALRKVEETLKDRPDDASLWYRRGTLLLELERWQDALESFRRVESLDPSFARLYVALSFVLGKLGRIDEAVAAQRQAVAAAAGVEAPEEAEGIDEAFAALAEDLLERAAEEQVVKRLEELGKAAAEPEAVEEDVEARLRRWAAEGYDVKPLRDVIEHEPDRARTALFQFDQNVRKVQVLKETVDALDPEGIEGEIARVRALFRAPYQIWKIEAEMGTLLEKADARDRTARARTLPSPALPTRPAARATGATNGRPGTPGRVNGLTAPTGRVNGQIAGVGRVNGLVRPGGAGRVNGLVNGLRHGRAGLTNGLTNGLGFTNGLGGGRFAAEARARRSRLFLVPLIAFALLSVAFFLPEPEKFVGRVRVDGNFDDWKGISNYTQPPSRVNPMVDLVEYRAWFQDDRLSVYARVNGSIIFGDSQRLDVLRIFVDADGNRATGYDAGRLGADLLLEVQGFNGSASSTRVQRWAGNATDRENWNNWTAAVLPFAAAANGAAVECQLDATDLVAPDAQPHFDAAAATLYLEMEDQMGSQSASAVLFGPTYGALTVEQRSAATQVSAQSADFLVLAFHAIGGDVTVSNVTIDRGPDTPPLSGFAGFTLKADAFQTVTLRVDASAKAPGTLLNASLAAVGADRPVTIAGYGARAYVVSTPSAPVVDGLFGEWNTTILRNDTDALVVPDANVDITQYAGQARGTTAFAYVEVAGDALGGAVAPVERGKPSAAGGAAAPPGGPSPPVRRTGEDVVQVFYHANGTTGGTVVGGIVANAYLEILGHYGRVRRATSFVWLNGWEGQGTAAAIVVGSRLEASIDVPGVDLRGARYVIQTRDWKDVGDTTQVEGVRGTRSSPSGVTFFDSYEADLPLAADDPFRFSAGALGLDWRLPQLAIARGADRTPLAEARPVPLVELGMAGRYSDVYGIGVDVTYAALPGTLKETFTFSSPPNVRPDEGLVLDFPMLPDPGLMVYAFGDRAGGDLLVNGTLSYVDGRGLSIDLPAPWIEDATGRRLDLRLRLETDRVAVQLPGDWLAHAVYPVVLDPTVTYTLQDNGPTYKVGENMGWSVAVGDFNGDGKADVLTGAPNWAYGSNTLIGYAYIYYGPFTADQTQPNVRINGTTIDTGRFGYAVAAGKFHSGSCSACWDALISHVSVASITGPVDIFFGSTTLSGDVSTPDVKFEPPSSPANFGFAVAAGNIDNANSDDVLIAEPGRTSNAGVVYLYKSPFASDVTTANYTLVPSTNSGGQLGRGGIAVGKIDSDAYPDVVVGEPFTGGSSHDGRVQFYKGSDFLSGSGNKSPDATLHNQTTGENFGGAVAVGRLNGDAYADVVVGAPLKTPATGGNGAAYIFTANSDGSGLTSGATPAQTLPSQSASENFGTSVLVLDWEDRGTAGVVVGAQYANATGTKRGSAYWFKTPLTSTTPDATLSGSQSTERFGFSLAGGKFGSDTRTQLFIGAYLWDKNSANNADNDGRVVVASVPEPAPLLIGGILVVGLAARSLQRRRLVRQRRELHL